MSEIEFDRFLSEWMREDQPSASAWVLDSVGEHAHLRSNRSAWRRLMRTMPSVIDRHRRAPGGDEPASRRLVGLAALVASVMALLLALPMITLPAGPGPLEDHAIVPGVSLPTPSLPPEASPATDSSDVPAVDGLTGSLWLEQAEGAPDHFLTLHPDGTVVERVDGSTTVGIGVWEPAGDHALSSIIVYTDADPVGHVTPGQSTHRAEWVLDDANETGTLSWRATLQSADGGGLPEVAGHGRIMRLHLAALPATARYPVPDEQPWTPELGPMAGGAGSGEVDTVGDLSVLSDCDADANDPPGSVVLHGDGTTFVASLGGIGAGLWAPSGPDTRAMTLWSTLTAAGKGGSWVAEKRGRLVMTGDQDGFEGRFVAAPRRLRPMDGTVLPPLDAAYWPSRGSVWLQPTEAATALVAYLSDGTVIARHPTYGTGTGSWQPTGSDSIAASVSFATLRLQDRRLLWEATIDPVEQRMSIEYQLVDANSGAVLEGSTGATRLSLAP
jgi:hypothetical protein